MSFFRDRPSTHFTPARSSQVGFLTQRLRRRESTTLLRVCPLRQQPYHADGSESPSLAAHGRPAANSAGTRQSACRGGGSAPPG